MMMLNNAKREHNMRLKFKPHKDIAPNGYVEYARGSLTSFYGMVQDNRTTIERAFGAAFTRDSQMMVIETVNQLPFACDDIIIDDMGKEYVITQVAFLENKAQGKFLKSGYLSKTYYLAVEGDE